MKTLIITLSLFLSATCFGQIEETVTKFQDQVDIITKSGTLLSEKISTEDAGLIEKIQLKDELSVIKTFKVSILKAGEAAFVETISGSLFSKASKTKLSTVKSGTLVLLSDFVLSDGEKEVSDEEMFVKLLVR